jgi:hypothetical protein
MVLTVNHQDLFDIGCDTAPLSGLVSLLATREQILRKRAYLTAKLQSWIISSNELAELVIPSGSNGPDLKSEKNEITMHYE